MTINEPRSLQDMRFESLDAMRGICALMVALYHFKAPGMIGQLALVQNGWLFVDYFFVLSGFVIAHSYGRKLAERSTSIARFMWLRIGRIYPLHAAVLVGFVALELLLLVFGDAMGGLVSRAVFTGYRGPESLIQSVFLLQSFGLPEAHGWNIPAWSIAAEMWTYLLFAFVFLLRGRAMLWVTAALVAVSAAIVTQISNDLFITFNGGIVRCIYGFGIGVLAYVAFRRWGGVGGTVFEAAVLIATLLFVAIAKLAVTYAAPFVFGAMIFVFASEKGAIANALKARVLVGLGLISYSVYMVHMFVQARLAEFFQVTKLVAVEADAMGRTTLAASPLAGDLITLAMVGLVIMASIATYQLVEKPARQWSRKRFAAHSR